MTTQNAGENRATESFINFWWEYKRVKPLWRTVWHFLIKLNM